MKIMDFIPVGRDNAISMTELALFLHKDKRVIRAFILSARRKGAPICSVCGGGRCGYFLPSSIDEARIYIREQSARIKSSREAIRPVVDFIRPERGNGNG